MNITKAEKAFYWIMFVLGVTFFGTAFFMKSGLDVAMRIVSGGIMAIVALAEIYPGIVAKTCRGFASMLISACAGLTRKLKRLRKREVINEADITETKRL